MSSATLEIKLSRPSRIYCPSEPLDGKIVVKSASSISHRGVRLAVNGSVNMQVRGGSAGLVESIVGAVKPIVIVNRIIEVRPSGRIASGTTEVVKCRKVYIYATSFHLERAS
ncbi:vacuolar protein sorting-associated protein 26C-like [Rhodamnia argentea]|uniref:Vacuolar protein sorting-associated protein 26C-like n=1 Tax=Rhodamnia argentea TaxID=178133 RepID=A0A8B8P8T4_9MYRT|nr:vacuolar protein sorting-associated protein 26C-like [Rhodamnia argentea]